MKTAITVRIEANLLAETRRCAQLENRTVTNFIETVLQRRVAELAPATVQGEGADAQIPSKDGAHGLAQQNHETSKRVRRPSNRPADRRQP